MIQVVFGEDVYDFEDAVRWEVTTDSIGSSLAGILRLYNATNEQVAAFMRWDNVSRVTESQPKSNTEFTMNGVVQDVTKIADYIKRMQGRGDLGRK